MTTFTFKSIISFVAVGDRYAQIAQLVEQRTENPRVDGSSPPLGTLFTDNGLCGCGSMVEHQPSKLRTWVRLPSPDFIYPVSYYAGFFIAQN